jgi:hypothetical protein
MPTLVPSDAAKTAHGVEDEIMVRRLAHHTALAFRVIMELVELRLEFNPILASRVPAEGPVRLAHSNRGGGP